MLSDKKRIEKVSKNTKIYLGNQKNDYRFCNYY